MSAAEEYFFDVTAKQSTEINKLKKRVLELAVFEDALSKWGEARLKLRDLQESPDLRLGFISKSSENVITQAFRAVDDEMHEVLCLAIEVAQTRRDAKK